MADQLVFWLANPGVTAVGATTPTGGSWSSGTYSFIVIPRYHPHDSRVCGDDCGVATFSFNPETSVPTYTLGGAFDNVSVAANDKVVLNFTPPSRNVRAYEVYYRSGASVAITDAVTRLTLTSTVYNTNGTITITMDAATPLTTARTVPIIAKSGSGDLYTIPGDCRYSFPAGAAFTVAGATADDGNHVTTGSPTLSTSGINTIIKSTTNLTGDVNDGTITYNIGDTDHTYFSPVVSDYIVIEPVLNMTYTSRALHSRDYRGAFTSVAYANETHVDAVNIEAHFASFASVSAFNQFTRWIKDCQELIYYDLGTSDLCFIAGAIGKFDALPQRPLGGKSSVSRYNYMFNITEEWRRDGV